MGLDSVELVMSFEERFGIDIPDADAERITTTRMVCDYVYSRVADQSWQPCPTHHAFHRLRRVAPPLPERLRPDTPLAVLCPLLHRGKRWRELGKVAGLARWPELRRPAWAVRGGTALVFGVAIATGLATWSITIGVLASVAACWLVVSASRSLATLFHPGMVTVGDLLQDIASKCLPPPGG